MGWESCGLSHYGAAGEVVCRVNKFKTDSCHCNTVSRLIIIIIIVSLIAVVSLLLFFLYTKKENAKWKDSKTFKLPDATPTHFNSLNSSNSNGRS